MREMKGHFHENEFDQDFFIQILFSFFDSLSVWERFSEIFFSKERREEEDLCENGAKCSEFSIVQKIKKGKKKRGEWEIKLFFLFFPKNDLNVGGKEKENFDLNEKKIVQKEKRKMR